MFKQHVDIALLLVRIVVGSTFVMHGLQKVFGFFGGSGLAGFTNWLSTLGIPIWLGTIAAYVELLGGISVLLGIIPELGALGLACMMIGAIYLVHGDKGYFGQNNGFEYPLNLLLLCLAIIIGGAGRFCLWSLFK
jgi:putative oxidoreductase